MTVKEKLVTLIQGEGFDFIAASEIATETLTRFLESGESRARYTIARLSFTFARSAVTPARNVVRKV